jgi:hypothetical protein
MTATPALEDIEAFEQAHGFASFDRCRIAEGTSNSHRPTFAWRRQDHAVNADAAGSAISAR